MLKGLPPKLQEQVLRARERNWVMGYHYSDNEIFNEHLDRVSLLMTLRGDGKDILFGTGNKKIDAQLQIEEAFYLIYCLQEMKKDYEKSRIKFFKRRRYNNLRIKTVKWINLIKTLHKKDMEKLIKAIPEQIL